MEPVFDIHFDNVARKVVARTLVNGEAKAVRIVCVEWPSGIHKGACGFGIDNFVVAAADHHDGAGKHSLDVKDWVDFRK